MKLFFIPFSLFLLASCSTPVSFFPTSGPFMQAKLVQPIIASAVGVSNNSGNISLILPDKESCTGKYSVIAPTFSIASAGASSIQLSSNLVNAWGSVYGANFTVGNPASINRGQAMLACDRGTTIQVEFFTGSGTGSGYGVAQDSNGNVYKVLF